MSRYTLSLMLVLVAGAAFAGITADDKHKLNHGYGTGAQLGTLVDQPGSLSVVWNASTGNSGSKTLRSGARASGNPGQDGSHSLGAKIPKQSVITRAWVEVTDPPVHFGPGSSPTIAFQCSTKTTGKTTVTIGAADDYSDGSFNGGTLGALTADDTLATMQRNDSTEDCQVQAVVTGQSASSGKITLFVEYLQIR
jgi:hypothetical protein